MLFVSVVSLLIVDFLFLPGDDFSLVWSWYKDIFNSVFVYETFESAGRMKSRAIDVVFNGQFFQSCLYIVTFTGAVLAATVWLRNNRYEI